MQASRTDGASVSLVLEPGLPEVLGGDDRDLCRVREGSAGEGESRGPVTREWRGFARWDDRGRRVEAGEE